MEFLPISINVTQKKLLLVGGGKVALQKIKSLLRFDVSITVIATAFDKAVEEIDSITRIEKNYEPSDLEGHFLVYACTDSKETNEIISNDCHKRNILASVVDNPELCDFISPAIYKTGDTSVSVSSNAQNPKQSVEIRDQIEQKSELWINGTSSPPKSSAHEYNRETDSPDNLHTPLSGGKGKVILAGFGPGDPGLLTLKANQYLREADIIFHDALLDISYLSQFKGEKVPVGKRHGKHSKKQEEINHLLLNEALRGKKVVRLKGGDPMIFGRGGEEISFLKDNHVDVKVIPGISTALAAAAQYGLPLTHRNISSSVTFCLGHDLSKRPFPKSDTLVFYMGANKQCEISKSLMEEGWSPETPVALMSNISNPQSKAVISKLGSLCQEKLLNDTHLLIVVGENVRKIR